MREILFRGRETDGDWAKGSLIVAGKYCCILENEDNVHPMDYPYLDNDLGTIDGKATPVIPETVGQYTGMTDKNGVKIFEDDIVKLYLIDGIEKGVIKFNDIMCRFMFVTKDGSYGFDRDCIFEIIGNIHNNPELLSN